MHVLWVQCVSQHTRRRRCVFVCVREQVVLGVFSAVCVPWT